MKKEQTELMLGVLENAPTIVFLGLWRTGAGLEAAAWSACAAAAAVLVLFRLLGRPYDTIVLGINISFLAMAPLIVGSFAIGQPDVARGLLGLAETATVATVFLTGTVLTLFARRGFIGAEGLSKAESRRYSLILLALAGGAVAWSAAHTGQQWLSIVLPLIVLFTARRFMLARIADRGPDSPAMAAAVLPVKTVDAG